MRKLLAVLLCLAMVFAFAACGGADENEEAVSRAGTYIETVAGRGVLTVEEAGGKATVTVDWSGSAYEMGKWQFTGTFDAEGVLEYTDCEKDIVTFKDDGTEEIQVIYTDGKGRLKETAEGLIWEDDEENIADSCVFAMQ